MIVREYPLGPAIIRFSTSYLKYPPAGFPFAS